MVGARTSLLAFALGLLAVVGCYKPQIADGSFKCAAGSKPCPDGFTCAADLFCHNLPVVTPDAGMCTFAVVTPVCADPPRGTEDCNPACQSHCACGRCNVVGGGARCIAVGTKSLGQTCDPSADDCGAGLICLTEACGNNLGRCYQHCTKNEQCNGTICQIPINQVASKGATPTDTGYKACDIASQDCDPVNNTGCPAAGTLNCYLTSANQTICDCTVKKGMLGESCAIYSDCAAGLVCISNVGGVAGPHCTAVCNLATPSCPGNRHCIQSGAKYGYCGT